MSPLIAVLAAASGTSARIVIPHIDYGAILPELILLGGVLVLIGLSAMTSRRPPTGVFAAVTVGIAVSALVASLRLWRRVQDHGAFTTIAHSVDVDGFAVFFLVLVSALLVVAAILGAGYLRREGIGGCEYYALALISGSGAMFMASANDLILIFLALEVLSIPLYVLAGFDRRRATSQEAAVKYFVLGAFSSAVFVYGIALVYGATGSTNLPEIAAFLAHNVITANGVLLAGVALIIVGFSFKVAAVPFHMWTPDVYQGAPTPVTGFMAAIAKAGGFAAFLRVFVATFPTLRGDWQPVVWALAAVTLLGGAVVALVQRDVKRMLAYSSINHAGFVLIGLQAATARGVAAGAYYVFAYAFIVLGSFAVVGVVGGKGDRRHDLEAYRGLATHNPVLATSFTVLLLAQAGVPFTTGFFAKFYVVEASVDAHSYALAVIAMASAAIAVFFYLRVVLLMFATQPAHSPAGPVVPAQPPAGGVATLVRPVAERLAVSPSIALGLTICLGVTVVFGVWPQPLIDFARAATLIFH
ncbi:MAG: NADH-quinone oxidoreductase subunit N [Acidimicrobiales bacterium]